MCARVAIICFFFNDTAPTELYPLPLHDALPISPPSAAFRLRSRAAIASSASFNLRRRANERGRGHPRSEEHMSELQSHLNLVCRLLLEKKQDKPTHCTCSSLSVPDPEASVCRPP